MEAPARYALRQDDFHVGEIDLAGRPRVEAVEGAVDGHEHGLHDQARIDQPIRAGHCPESGVCASASRKRRKPDDRILHPGTAKLDLPGEQRQKTQPESQRSGLDEAGTFPSVADADVIDLKREEARPIDGKARIAHLGVHVETGQAGQGGLRLGADAFTADARNAEQEKGSRNGAGDDEEKRQNPAYDDHYPETRLRFGDDTLLPSRGRQIAQPDDLLAAEPDLLVFGGDMLQQATWSASGLPSTWTNPPRSLYARNPADNHQQGRSYG